VASGLDLAAYEAVADATRAVRMGRSEKRTDGVDGVLTTVLLPGRYLELSRPLPETGMGPLNSRPFGGVIELAGPDAPWYALVLELFGDEVDLKASYDRPLFTMARFCRTGEEPIAHEVLPERTAIHYAALLSARKGGRPADPCAPMRTSTTPGSPASTPAP